MGKRSDFTRRKHDAYDTPREAVRPLLRHLPPTFTYWEPCAGAGDLIEALTGGNCVAASDIEPRPAKGFEWIATHDAMKVPFAPPETDYIITNPPWSRPLLHPMIDHFRKMRPTWLLFDADWAHTKQAAPYLKYCHKIVSVGRVKWIADSPHTGKDNAAWYLFDEAAGDAKFYGQEVGE